jgi:hypothetical protein
MSGISNFAVSLLRRVASRLATRNAPAWAWFTGWFEVLGEIAVTAWQACCSSSGCWHFAPNKHRSAGFVFGHVENRPGWTSGIYVGAGRARDRRYLVVGVSP